MPRTAEADLPARWTRFAQKGGIGECIAMCDCVVADTEYLNYMKDDKITVLLQLPDRENLYLGYVDGRVGLFSGANVYFLTKLKKPIMALRVPTRLSNYSPSLTSSQTPDSDAFPDRLGRRMGVPNSPSIHPRSQTPYLFERQRCPSIALSTVSTSSWENTSSIYDDYKNSRFSATNSETNQPARNRLGVRPWVSSVVQTLPRGHGDLRSGAHSAQQQPTKAETCKIFTDYYAPEVMINACPPNAYPASPQGASEHRHKAFLPHNRLSDVIHSPSPKHSPLRYSSWNASSVQSSTPFRPSPFNPAPILHMPVPRAPLLLNVPAKTADDRARSHLRDKSFVAGDGFGNRVLVEDDDECEHPIRSNDSPNDVAESLCLDPNLSHQGPRDAGYSPFNQRRTPFQQLSINIETLQPPGGPAVSPFHTNIPAVPPVPPEAPTPSLSPELIRLAAMLQPPLPPPRSRTSVPDKQTTFVGIAHHMTNSGSGQHNLLPRSQSIDPGKVPSSGKTVTISGLRRASSRTRTSARERYGHSSDTIDQENNSSSGRSAGHLATTRMFGIFTPPGRMSARPSVRSSREAECSQYINPLWYDIRKNMRIRRPSLRVHSSSSSSSCYRRSKSDVEYSSFPSN